MDHRITEAWRPIPDLPGYSASDEGRIRRDSGTATTRRGKATNVTERVLTTTSRQWNGYFVVAIGSYARPVHRLVAAAFHGPLPPGSVVRRLDGDKADNRPDNLRVSIRCGMTLPLPPPIVAELDPNVIRLADFRPEPPKPERPARHIRE